MKLKQIALAAAALAGPHVLPAQAANILVVLSDESRLELKDGKVYETGAYLNELMQPVQAFLDAGHHVTFATPLGRAPAIDKSSLDKSYFGGDAKALQAAQDYVARIHLLAPEGSPVISLARVGQIGYDHFDAVYVPGGHAPMQDLLRSPELGRLLRDFHAKGKVTALECHGPIALLSALPDAAGFAEAMAAGKAKAQPAWTYAGYRMTVFGDREEAQAVPMLMKGADMKFYPQSALATAGAQVQVAAKPFDPNVVEDRELITGENPASAPALAKAVLQRLH